MAFVFWILTCQFLFCTISKANDDDNNDDDSDARKSEGNKHLINEYHLTI